MSLPIQTCPTKYKWAVNFLKLNVAYTQLMGEKANDPKLEITEAPIKERYVHLKGLLESERAANLKVHRPSVTANVK